MRSFGFSAIHAMSLISGRPLASVSREIRREVIGGGYHLTSGLL